MKIFITGATGAIGHPLVTGLVAAGHDVLVNGRPIKSINQQYNKTRAILQSQLKGNIKTSKRIQALTCKRNNRVDNYLHNASRWIIDYSVAHNCA